MRVLLKFLQGEYGPEAEEPINLHLCLFMTRRLKRRVLLTLFLLTTDVSGQRPVLICGVVRLQTWQDICIDVEDEDKDGR